MDYYLKHQHQHGMRNLHYQIDIIQYLIFRIISNIKKAWGKIQINHQYGYVNKIENRIEPRTFNKRDN